MNKITKLKTKDIEKDITSTKSTIKKISKFPKISYDEDLEEYSGKEYSSFVKSIEKLVRSSYEYKEYIYFLKTEIDLNSCHYFKNMNANYCQNISIEIHHHPFTLFDIVSIVYNHIQNEGRLPTFNSFTFAELIMRLHYDNMIGVIPLSKTLHELAHNDVIFLNANYCYGEWKLFAEKYKNGFTESMIGKLDEIKMLSELDTYKEKNKFILEKHFTYLDIEGIKMPKFISNGLNKKIA